MDLRGIGVLLVFIADSVSYWLEKNENVTSVHLENDATCVYIHNQNSNGKSGFTTISLKKFSVI